MRHPKMFHLKMLHLKMFHLRAHITAFWTSLEKLASPTLIEAYRALHGAENLTARGTDFRIERNIASAVIAVESCLHSLVSPDTSTSYDLLCQARPVALEDAGAENV
jgi:hypothetical protein